jgi:outer membrane receptor protein involved in Fe transport
LAYARVQLEEADVPPFVDETFEKSRFDPKVGLQINLTPTTTLRSAYFKTLRKFAFEDTEALEPTLIGGINQRFTDLSGDRAENWGLGLDQKFGSSTYLGVEGIHRHLTEDDTPAISNVLIDFDKLTTAQKVTLGDRGTLPATQDMIRAYAYRVLTQRIVASFDYHWTRFERDIPELQQDIRTHRVGAGLRYLDPSGIFTYVRATWRRQDDEGSFVVEDGRHDFWVADAGVGYRLPHRHGSILIQLSNIFDRKFALDQFNGEDEIVDPEFAARLLFAINF